MTSLYSHDATLVLFYWVIKQIIRKNILSLETGASLVLTVRAYHLVEIDAHRISKFTILFGTLRLFP